MTERELGSLVNKETRRLPDAKQFSDNIARSESLERDQLGKSSVLDARETRGSSFVSFIIYSAVDSRELVQLGYGTRYVCRVNRANKMNGARLSGWF